MIMKYCDLCGSNVQILHKENLLISFRGNYENRRDFQICDYCKDKLENAKRQAEVDFIEKSETFIKNGIDYGEFRQVGTCEQGGIMCPKCGYSNNSYTFDGKCQQCGYGKERISQ